MALPVPYRLFRPWALALLVMLLGPATPRLQAKEEPTEYELKAVMLFNLARFVEWPAATFADANSPVVIGILGRNPFGDNLEKAVHGERVNGRGIVVEQYNNLQALQKCHILFISTSERSRVSLILAKLKGKATLSVSEIEGFCRLSGGMVRFYTNDQKKIRLQLNLASARAEGLGVSSKLIQVAELQTTSLLWPRFPGAAGLVLTARSSHFPPLMFDR